MLYNNLSTYMRERYGSRLRKICIDGGFTCPNRDGTAGEGGCIFCGERGSGEHIATALSISEQVMRGLANLGKEERVAVYFQSFTSTYAPLEDLRRRYDSALLDERIALLAIGTRPDCITDEIAELIESYKSRVDVWVELGLQTASDATAALINRGYTTDVFRRAVEILERHSVPVVAHVMIGLPGEGQTEVDATVDLVNASGVFGVKLHSVYVMEGTRLADMYARGEYVPPTRVEYIALAARSIARLRPDITLHRITGDCPRDLLVAPLWNRDKNSVIEGIRRELEENGLRQGSLFAPDN